jgi:hypothetical protein
MPVYVLWHINNTNMSGNYNNASINYPSWWNSANRDWINVTYRDTVNNSITICIPVTILDTNKPVPVVIMYNETGAKVTSILQNSIIKLYGLNSTDPQGGYITSYLWTIHNSTGANVSAGKGYNITNGTMTSGVVTLNFTKYGMYYVFLNVTGRSGKYNVYNQSLQVIPVGPDMVLNKFNWTGTFTQGSLKYIYVNISNTGNAPALQYNLIFYVNGVVYSNSSYTNLLKGKTAVEKISWTPSSSGNFTLKIRIYTAAEPEIYLGDNIMSKIVSVSQSAWILPATIIGIVAIIVIVAFVAFRLNKSRAEQAKFKKKGGAEKPKQEKK